MKISMWIHLAAGLAGILWLTFLAEPLDIGDRAPLTETAVMDVSGEELTLAGVAGENGLLVIFSCNTCPWVARWEDRYNPLADLARQKGIGVIALNPNSSGRDNGDGFEDMQQRSAEKEYRFFYALDKNSMLAEAFGATRTPDIFLFNADLELVYKGAIDDNAASAEEVEHHYLREAITRMSEGRPVENKSTKSLGCTIKWPDS